MIKCNLLKLSFVRNIPNKKCVELSLTSFGTAKNDCVIKTGDQFCYFFFLLLIISEITSSKTINTLHFLSRLYSSIIL